MISFCKILFTILDYMLITILDYMLIIILDYMLIIILFWIFKKPFKPRFRGIVKNLSRRGITFFSSGDSAPVKTKTLLNP